MIRKKLKILYAFPATGNGHISRAITLNPYLSKIGNVDYLISGTNSSLQFPYEIKYRLKGISLFFNHEGGLNHIKFIQQLKALRIYNEVTSIPVEKYDWVISDFEPISALACMMKRKKFMHWGHQASFQYKQTPRPKERNRLGELILKSYVKSECNFGLHFKSYNKNITGPVLKNSILESDRKSDDLIAVYLPQYPISQLVNLFSQVKGIDIQIFHPEISIIQTSENLEFFPINKELFDNSLIHCKLLITGGGFETPAEALYLNKRVISIPIKSHYEQACNAEALRLMQIPVFKDLNFLPKDIILSEFETYGMIENSLLTKGPQEICYMALSIWEDYIEKNYGGFEMYEVLLTDMEWREELELAEEAY